MKQKADEELRKCRRQISSLQLELQKARKELKEREEHSTLAEEDIKRYLTENSKLHDKIKILQESISSPSGDPRNSALSRMLHESPAPSHLRLSNLGASPCVPNLTQKSRVKTEPLGLNVSSIRPKLSDPQEQEDRQTQRNKEFRKASDDDTPEPESLKFKRMKVDPVPSSSGYYYDGLGGHSRPDIYPNPSSSLRLAKSDSLSKAVFKTKPVTIKTKGKIQTKTLDFFFTE